MKGRDDPGRQATHNAPEVYAVRKGRSGWTLTRRGLLGAAAAVAAATGGKAQAQCSAATRAATASMQRFRISSDGRSLLTADVRSVKFWSLPWGGLYRTVSIAANSTYAISDVVPSVDGQRLYVSHAGDLEVWSAPNAVREFTRQGAGWGNVAITPDGKYLLHEGTGIGIWALPEVLLLRNVPGSFEEAISISPDGRLLAAPRSGVIDLISVPDGAVFRTINYPHKDYRDNATATAWSPDGEFLAAGLLNGRILLFGIPDGTLARDLVGHYVPDDYNIYITDISISPNGRFMAASSRDCTVSVWSMPNADKVGSLAPTGESLQMSCVIFSPDSKLLFTGGTDGYIQVWSMPDLTPSTCLVDLSAIPPTENAARYQVNGVTYTVACGSPVPPGAVCTCNCIAGTGGSGGGGGGGGHYWYPN